MMEAQDSLGETVLPSEEMVRLWGTFQVKFRLSVAYRAAIVLIDHEHSEAVPPAPAEVRVVVGTLGASSTP